MASRKWIGRIVLIDGEPAQKVKSGILFLATERCPATLFPDGGSAWRAIRHTLEYSKENNFGWENCGYRVVGVRGA